MVKLAKNKKKSTRGATTSKSKKAKPVDITDEEEELDDEEEVDGETSNNEKESKSTLLTDCKSHFDTQDLYEVLNLEKKTATQTEIKKAYYKLSLKYHPDKVTDEALKEESKTKFQIVGKIYSILCDEEKKKLYDESGVIEGEDNFTGSSEDWRRFDPKITEDDIKQFFKNYKSSDEEKNDLFRIYEKRKGDMDLIMEEMFCVDVLEDESRFKEILQDAIDKGLIGKYDKFVSESKRKAGKRKAYYEKEAKEAEEMKKKMGLDEKSLESAIMARMGARKVQADNFLADLEKKYASKEKAGRTKNSKIFKLDEVEVESPSEEEEEPEEESEDERKTSKKTSKKSKIGKRLSTKSKAKQPIKRLS